jgi:tripartite-type tricarboxylate transporter receptor subunit TctC
MLSNKRQILIGLTAALLCAAVPFTSAMAATPYPTKPVRLVVPYAAGGPVDSLARALAVSLSSAWGQQVIVDNRPGANEIIGATNVAKSQPDGYTLMLATDPSLSLNPYLFKKLSYDPLKELVPVTRVAVSNMALVVPTSLPVNNLKEFVAYAKANPGKLSYGSSGIGNGTHLSVAQFARDNQLEMTHIPYKGLAPTLQDMLGGSIQAAVGAVSVIAPFAQDGKLKVLGVSGPRRASSLPIVPTFTEAGFPKFEASFYFGIVAPAGIDPEIRAKVAADVKKIAGQPEFRATNLDKFALDSVLDTPAEFEAFLAKDRAAAQAKITASGAQLD